MVFFELDPTFFPKLLEEGLGHGEISFTRCSIHQCHHHLEPQSHTFFLCPSEPPVCTAPGKTGTETNIEENAN